MSNAAVTLKYLLLGDASSASAAMKKVGGEADQTGGKFHGMATKTNVALLAMTGTAVAFGKKSIDTFKQVGSETLGLQRIIGGTAEQSSRLVFAAQESGVGFETLTKSTGKLEKALGAAEGSAATNAAMIKTLGFNYRDAHGRILPMSDLIPKLADKFAKMPAGAEKTALAMKLFGKSGADMLPFLNKGAKGIQDLQKESDKFGTTLTGKNLAALKASKAGQREWNASLEGLRIQVGAQLLPIMNKLVGFIRDYIIPIVARVTDFIRRHQTAVLIAAAAIGTIVLALKAWAIIQAIMNVLMMTNPIVLIVTALIALAAAIYIAYQRSATFRNIVQTVFGVIKTVIADVWRVIKPIFDLWVWQFKLIGATAMWLWHSVIQPAWDGIKTLIAVNWAIIKGIFNAFVTVGRAIGDGVMWAWNNVIKRVFSWISTGISGLRDFVGGVVKTISSIFRGIGDGIRWAYDNVIKPVIDAITGAINAALGAWRTLTSQFHGQGIFGSGSLFNPLPSLLPNAGPAGSTKGESGRLRASGGPITAGVPYIVGERRAEVFVPDTSGRLIANPRFGNGGGGMTIVQHNTFNGIAVDQPTVQRALVSSLEHAVNSTGLKLNIANGIR